MSWRLRRRLRKRAAFWDVRRERLTLAVIASTRDEPLLVSCLWVEASVLDAHGTTRFCPGVFELARTASATELPHVVGLSAEYCALEGGSPAAAMAEAKAEIGRVPAQGTEAWALVNLRALDDLEDLFRAARLDLAVVDTQDCALLTLADVLGVAAEHAADLDPLTAVSVSAECEHAAAAAGKRLCVPIGLALAWLGGGAAGDG